MKTKAIKRTETNQRQEQYSSMTTQQKLAQQRANGHADTTKQSKKLLQQL